MKKAYVKYRLSLGSRAEERFVCLPCEEVSDEGNLFTLVRDGHVVGQFDRGAVEIFYYTEEKT